MNADLQEVSADLSRDLSPQWLELSSRVRRLAEETSPDSALAGESLRLCDHVERLHADVEHLLASLRNENDGALSDQPLETLPTPPEEKVTEANLQIQNEMHQKSDLQQIIKALFMWKDDPEERARGKVD